MKAVLFIGHGSREREGNEQVIQMVNNIKNRMIEEVIIETCFLELANPDIGVGIERCVQRGASSIAVVPIMLFAASHSKLHIPMVIDEAKKNYSSITFTYGRPIGIHPEMLSICEDRVADAIGQLPLEKENIGVVLLGRGCSDEDTNSDLYKLARLLREKLGVKKLEPAYIAVTDPSLKESVEKLIRLGAKKIIILPYLLFTGVLMKRLEVEMKTLEAQFPQADLVLASYLGFHPKLENVLIERMNEVLAETVHMNCDMCRFRIDAVEHMSHHHHHHDHHHIEMERP